MNARGSSSALQTHALQIFRAGVAAADPAEAVRRTLRYGNGLLEAVGVSPLGPLSRIRAVAFGKAACAMSAAAEDILSSDVFPGPGIAVTSYGNGRPLARFRVMEAGHPLPDEPARLCPPARLARARPGSSAREGGPGRGGGTGFGRGLRPSSW